MINDDRLDTILNALACISAHIDRAAVATDAALNDRDKARSALAALLDAECGSPATCALDTHRAAWRALGSSLTYEQVTGDHA